MKCVKMLLAVAAVLAVFGVVSAQANTIFYSFGDDAHGGFTLNDSNGQNPWIIKSASTVAEGYAYDLSWGGRNDLGDSGTYVLGETPAANESIGMDWSTWPQKSGNVHKTLWAQSATFKLDGTHEADGSVIDFWMDFGGPAITPMTLPIPTDAGTWGSMSGNDDSTRGMDGVAVIDHTTGTIVKTWESNWAWNHMTWDGTGAVAGHVYSLNLIDQLAGTASAFAVDAVNIHGVAAPVPEPSTIVLVLGAVLSAAGLWLRK